MRIFLTGILGLALQCSAADRPNIVVVLADNWAWPHASIAGDKVVKTPNFDKVAKEGLLFEQTYCQVPSCSPARAVLLTGQAMHRLGEGANLWGNFTEEQTYPELLAQSGYAVGFEIKGWGPGLFQGKPMSSKAPVNPAGKRYANLKTILEETPKSQPICYWFGSHEPHRPWNKARDHRASIDESKIEVPPYLPDNPVVRSDIADYYAEVQLFDDEVGEVRGLLKQFGRDQNTLLLVLGDNGWQMPRGLANVYDVGVRTPMAIHWPGKLRKTNHRIKSFISFEDIAPTILDAAGLPIPEKMTGNSLMPLLSGGKYTPRQEIFLERERHANVRADDLSYPCRAIRTHDLLYIQNLKPDRWPAGDPQEHWAVGPYGDVDAAPTKAYILSNRSKPDVALAYKLGFAKRPPEELYDLRYDPWQLQNLAADPSYDSTRTNLKKKVVSWMRDTNDPRATPEKDHVFDVYPYFGGSVEDKRKRIAARSKKGK